VVGEFVGLPGETIRRYRNGTCPLPLHVAAAVARRLGISAAWLVHGVGPKWLKNDEMRRLGKVFRAPERIPERIIALRRPARDAVGEIRIVRLSMPGLTNEDPSAQQGAAARRSAGIGRDTAD
jgi:hypothetical protein